MLKTILTKEQLERIKEHKYSPCGYSAVDLVLNKYVWVPVSNHLPYAISPNMITLLGVVMLGLGTSVVYYYDNTLNGVLPMWVYFFLTFTVFFFQTMDAVDGKHARNTNRASPFGQLVDHGLDIFSYAFQLVMVVIGHRLGSSWGNFLYQFFCYAVYYSHTWEEYYSGVFSTQIDGVGVSEFQILAAIVILFVPMFGEAGPHYNFFGMYFSTFFALFVFGLGILHVYTTVSRTLVKIPETHRKDCMKFFIPFLPILLSMILVQFLDIFKIYTLEMMVLNGLVFSYLTSEQIIATTSKSPQINFHLDSALYVVALIVAFFFEPEKQVYVIGIYALYCFQKYIVYIFSVSKQIMTYLNIGF